LKASFTLPVVGETQYSPFSDFGNIVRIALQVSIALACEEPSNGIVVVVWVWVVVVAVVDVVKLKASIVATRSSTSASFAIQSALAFV
jgi:hypothetical protein